MVSIIPAILPRNSEELEKKLERVRGEVSRVQLDVVDGKFSEIKTIGPEELNRVDTMVLFDVHLMVERPENWIKRCVMGGVDRVFGQVERMTDKVAFIADAQVEGLAVGLAYDIDTFLDGLEEVVADLDAVLLMSVKAGGQGREFDERVLEKIKQVRKMSKTVRMVIDGAMDEERIKKCIAAEGKEEMGKDELNRSTALLEFAVGSHLFESDDVRQELLNLKNLKEHDS